MEHITYLYYDPKTQLPIYVGMGKKGRERDHYIGGKRSFSTRLRNTLKKREAEGFEVAPIVLSAPSREHAAEMEMLLIAMIGREDLGTGPLFNLTDGGDGGQGWKPTPEWCAATSERRKKHFENPEAREVMRQAAQKSSASTDVRRAAQPKRPCTFDGVTIYESRQAAWAAVGKNPNRVPGFRYMTPRKPNKCL